eukprot:Seg12982.4 transcript_id=Seg12982.4/GoldUCD/mRNA.D3Y31 product="hypothetical protein" protein_id=Seg12982.4/GoldUCD/D3Y31
MDMMSLRRQIKRAVKDYGDSQKQGVKRWGVFTARELAIYTQAFGKRAATQKIAMMRDGRNVILTHQGGTKKTARGNYKVTFNGKSSYIKPDNYLNTVDEIIAWIESQRTGGRRRTRRLPIHERKVCKESLFKRAINQKHKAKSGMAKDGFIDAGDSISRGQRGRKPERIGQGFLKWARKDATLGSSVERGRLMKRYAKLINKIGYTRKSYVLKKSDTKKAVRQGGVKMLKWYRVENRSYPCITVTDTGSEEDEVLDGVYNPLTIEIALEFIPNSDKNSGSTEEEMNEMSAQLETHLECLSFAEYLNDYPSLKIFDIQMNQQGNEDREGRAVSIFTLEIVCCKT